MPIFTKDDVQRYRQEGLQVIADFANDPAFNHYVASTNRYAHPLMTGVFYTILVVHRRPAEFVVVHNKRITRQASLLARPESPAKLVVVDDVHVGYVDELKSAAERFRDKYGVYDILYFAPTLAGELFTERIHVGQPSGQISQLDMPEVTRVMVERFQQQAQPVLTHFSRDPSYHTFVTSVDRDSQPYTSAAFYSIFFNGRSAELAVRYRGRVIRQTPVISRPELKTKLVVVDKAPSDREIEDLRQRYDWLREHHGVQEILYMAKPGNELFTEFIPQTQTAQSSDSPAAGQR